MYSKGKKKHSTGCQNSFEKGTNINVNVNFDVLIRDTLRTMTRNGADNTHPDLFIT